MACEWARTAAGRLAVDQLAVLVTRPVTADLRLHGTTAGRRGRTRRLRAGQLLDNGTQSHVQILCESVGLDVSRDSGLVEKLSMERVEARVLTPT